MKFLIPTFTLALGFILGKYLFPTIETKKDKEIVYKTKTETKTVKVLDQSTLDAAKALHGEALLLFLANIGLKLTTNEKKSLDEYLAQPIETFTPEQREAKLKTILADNLKDENAPRKAIKKTENENNNSTTISNVESVANNFLLEKPNIYKAQAKYAKKFDRRIRQILGDYYGTLIWRKNGVTGRIDTMELVVDFRGDDKGQVIGDFTLAITDPDGRLYSESRGTGGNKDVMLHPNDPEMVIIQASPNTFLHGKINPFGIFNYYQDGEHVGYVQLFKN